MIVPATQLAAWEAIRDSGDLGRYQWETYDFIARNPGTTRNEIDHALAPGRPNPPYSRRLSELERAGVIHRLGTRDGRDRWYATQARTVNRGAIKAPAAKRDRELLERIRAILEDRSSALFPDPRVTRIKILIDEELAQ